MMKKHSILILCALFAMINSCKPDDPIYGCTDPGAINYDAQANTQCDDHCCVYTFDHSDASDEDDDNNSDNTTVDEPQDTCLYVNINFNSNTWGYSDCIFQGNNVLLVSYEINGELQPIKYVSDYDSPIACGNITFYEIEQCNGGIAHDSSQNCSDCDNVELSLVID